MNEQQFLAIENLVTRLQDALARTVVEADPEWFGWQSLPLISFFAGMHKIRGHLGEGRHKFVDVGSGIGTKLFLADQLGFEAVGIEQCELYAQISLDMFPECKIHITNALDFEAYDQFDVIYSYRIARPDVLQDKVNAYIVANMKEGAVFFSNDTVETTNQLMQQDVQEIQ